jgi:hypothetical protein
VDGIAGVDLATVILDLTPSRARAARRRAVAPRPEPTPAELAARGVKG